jgi:hypothetical protein
MDFINPKFAYFSILIVSISFVFAQGISNNYLSLSAEGSQFLKNDVASIIGVQDNPDNGIESSPPDVDIESEGTNQSTGDLSNTSSQGGSGGNNQTGGLVGDTLSSQAGSGSNETGSGVPGDSESSQTTNQTVDTEQTQTTNQTVDTEQTQTTNQTVNTNQTQTSNQDVNVQTNVDVEMKQRLDLKITEEEGEAPISIEEQNTIESQDKIIVTEHIILTGPDCRSGNVLDGATNAEDLRVLLECQDATGIVMHTKKMDDGDYKFFLKLDPQFAFLVNDKNREETEGFLVVEIVPPHQDGMYLPQDGDRVHVWGAWVTDKPKGWHEIHPTWKVVKM